MSAAVLRMDARRARVVANAYLSRVANLLSGFGASPRVFPRSPAESAELLAGRAADLSPYRGFLSNAQGVRRLSVDEWAEVYWQRRAGPLHQNEEACLVYFATFALLTRDA